MAVFDSLKKKTQNFAGTVAINSQITENERNIQNLFNQLGRDYYDLSEKYPIEEFTPIIARIKELMSKNAELNEEVKKLKGIKKCLKCNAEMPYDAVFCPLCGYNNGSSVGSNVTGNTEKQCPNCMAVVKQDAAFCPNCGSKV